MRLTAAGRRGAAPGRAGEDVIILLLLPQGGLKARSRTVPAAGRAGRKQAAGEIAKAVPAVPVSSP